MKQNILTSLSSNYHQFHLQLTVKVSLESDALILLFENILPCTRHTQLHTHLYSRTHEGTLFMNMNCILKTGGIPGDADMKTLQDFTSYPTTYLTRSSRFWERRRSSKVEVLTAMKGNFILVLKYLNIMVCSFCCFAGSV